MDTGLFTEEYYNTLVNTILPFWLKHGIDKEYGGIYTGLDIDGTLIETDKSVWFQGRALWTFSTAIILLKQRQESKNEDNSLIIEQCLQACNDIVFFIEKYCTDTSDGRMYFRVTKDGKPVIKRLRYVFSETFAIIGFAAYARATGKIEYCKRAFEIFNNVQKILNTPNALIPKFDSLNRKSRGFGLPMILLNTVSELRLCFEMFDSSNISFCNDFIDNVITEIKEYYVRPEKEVVIEQCNFDGSIQHEHIEGRQLNPGHAIEGAWFIMKEGLYRKDVNLQKLGVTMLDWMWKWGWDEQYGGIIYFRDIDGKSMSEYWHDMKFWWPQNEAVIACAYAYKITGDQKYKANFIKAHEYFKDTFLDTVNGSCFGYFHRDGSRSTDLKGNMYKGPFHTPRMYMEVIAIKM